MNTQFDKFMDYFGEARGRLTHETLRMIFALYTEPHRKYHNLEHIFYLADLAKTADYHPYSSIFTMILFHDAVYYPNSKFNEELSADLYASRIHKDDHEDEVFNAINASKNHTLYLHPQYLSSVALDFLDYDLQGLATDQYYENGKKIFMEFSPFVERQQFIEGRKKFLSHMLGTERIYWNHPEWEAKARQNMHTELSAIKTDDYNFSEQLVDGSYQMVYAYGEHV